jgi:hypothetical protein
VEAVFQLESVKFFYNGTPASALGTGLFAAARNGEPALNPGFSFQMGMIMCASTLAAPIRIVLILLFASTTCWFCKDPIALTWYRSSMMIRLVAFSASVKASLTTLLVGFWSSLRQVVLISMGIATIDTRIVCSDTLFKVLAFLGLVIVTCYVYYYGILFLIVWGIIALKVMLMLIFLSHKLISSRSSEPPVMRLLAPGEPHMHRSSPALDPFQL